MMRGNNRILIVDDDLMNLNMLENILVPDYEVCSTDDSFEAIRLAKKNTPDLILLDILMPQLSGIEICSIIREDERLKRVPVLFLTGVDRVENALDRPELGTVDCLLKPYRIQALKLRVRNYIELKRLHDQVEDLQNQLASQRAAHKP
jgi:PleD family two-component response regulator